VSEDSPSGGNGFIGRESALRTLLRLYEETAFGRGHFVTISGETGMGKTALFNEFTRRVASDDALILTGTCLYQQSAEPYHPILEALEPLGSRGKMGNGAGRFPGGQQPAEAMVPLGLLGVEIQDAPKAPELDTRNAQNILFDKVADIIKTHANDRVVVLFLDNLQWADPATLGLLPFLLYSIQEAKVMVVGAFRPEDLRGSEKHPLEEVLYSLSRDKALTALELGPMSEEEIGRLAQAVIGGDELPPAFIEFLMSRCGGNPLFLKEVIDELKSSVLIQRGMQGWESCIELGEVSLPESVGEILEMRFSKLDRSTRKVFQKAAVLGSEFDFETLLLFSEDDEEEVVDAIDELLDAGLIRERDEGESYVFKNALIQEAVNQKMSGARRRLLHKRAGYVMEKMNSASPGKVAYALARHFRKGKVPDKLLQYSVLAGDLAIKSYAPAMASEYYTMALDALDRIEMSQENMTRRQEVLMRLASCSDTMGEWDGALYAYGEAVGMLPPDGSEAERARIHSSMGRLHRKKGNWEKALEHFDLAISLGTAAGDSLATAEAKYGKCIVNYKKGDYAEAIKGCQECLSNLEGIDGPDTRREYARFKRGLGAAHYRLGNMAEAKECYKESLDIFHSQGDEYGVAQTRHRLGMLYNRQGEYEKAARELEKSLASMEERRDIYEISKISINLGEVLFNQGQLDEALERYARSERLAKQLNNDYGLAIAYGLTAKLQMVRGELDEAEKNILQNKELSERLGSKWGLGCVYRDLGELYLARERPDVALGHLERSEEYFKETGSRFNVKEVLALKAGALHDSALASAPPDRTRLESALSLFREAGDEEGAKKVEASIAELENPGA